MITLLPCQGAVCYITLVPQGGALGWWLIAPFRGAFGNKLVDCDTTKGMPWVVDYVLCCNGMKCRYAVRFVLCRMGTNADRH